MESNETPSPPVSASVKRFVFLKPSPQDVNISDAFQFLMLPILMLKVSMETNRIFMGRYGLSSKICANVMYMECIGDGVIYVIYLPLANMWIIDCCDNQTRNILLNQIAYIR